jgi:hypothetical protein
MTIFILGMIACHLLASWGLGRFDRSRGYAGIAALCLAVSGLGLAWTGVALLQRGVLFPGLFLDFVLVPASVLSYRGGLFASWEWAVLFGVRRFSSTRTRWSRVESSERVN